MQIFKQEICGALSGGRVKVIKKKKKLSISTDSSSLLKKKKKEKEIVNETKKKKKKKSKPQHSPKSWYFTVDYSINKNYFSFYFMKILK